MTRARPKFGSNRPSLIRIVWALPVLALAYLSVSHTLANAIEKAAPGQAHALASYDGRLSAAAAMDAFNRAPSPNEGDQAGLLAMQSLRRDPTAVDALTVLALKAQLRNDPSAARDLFDYSLLLSRRELRPRLWAIEEAVSRGDISAALKNYDIALRTSKSAPALLFPVLSEAIGEAKIRAPLIGIISESPVWREDFLAFLASNGSRPDATRLLFQEARSSSIPINDDHRSGVVNGFVSQGDIPAAWDYYETFRADAKRDRSRDPHFSFAGKTKTVFDWRPIEHTAIIPDASKGRGLVDFSVPPAVGGALLMQFLTLPPGRYQIEGHTRDLSQPAESRPYWVLECMDGRQVGRLDLPNSRERGGTFFGFLNVDRGCPIQKLILLARSTHEIAGVSGQIDYVSLRPAT